MKLKYIDNGGQIIADESGSSKPVPRKDEGVMIYEGGDKKETYNVRDVIYKVSKGDEKEVYIYLEDRT